MELPPERALLPEVERVDVPEAERVELPEAERVELLEGVRDTADERVLPPEERATAEERVVAPVREEPTDLVERETLLREPRVAPRDITLCEAPPRALKFPSR